MTYSHPILLLPELSQLPTPYGEHEASTIATAPDPRDPQLIHLALHLNDAAYRDVRFRMPLRREDRLRTEQGWRTFGSILDADLIGSKMVVKVRRFMPGLEPSDSPTAATHGTEIQPSDRPFEESMRALSAMRERLTRHDESAPDPNQLEADGSAEIRHADDIEVDPNETGTPPPDAIRAYTEHGLAEMSGMPVEPIRSAFEFLRSRGTRVQRINGDFCVDSSPGIEALCLAFRMFMLMNKRASQSSSQSAADSWGDERSA